MKEILINVKKKLVRYLPLESWRYKKKKKVEEIPVLLSYPFWLPFVTCKVYLKVYYKSPCLRDRKDKTVASQEVSLILQQETSGLESGLPFPFTLPPHSAMR